MGRKALADIVAANVNKLIVRRGKTKYEAAGGAGLSRPGFDAILDGTGNPNLESLAKIADYFEVNAVDLLDPDFEDEGPKKLLHAKRTPKVSEVLREFSKQLTHLSANLDDIPTELLDRLAGQDQAIYDALLNVLESLAEETGEVANSKRKVKDERKQNGRK